jgi:esterase/lipase
MNEDLINRITYHLSSGGLFNPELADHLAVRNLLMECREALAQPEGEYERGFIDGMQKQMQSSVDKAVNAMSRNDISQERVDERTKLRHEVLEEVAKEFDKMPFGDTAASFAQFVRNMKR